MLACFNKKCISRLMKFIICGLLWIISMFAILVIFNSIKLINTKNEQITNFNGIVRSYNITHLYNKTNYILDLYAYNSTNFECVYYNYYEGNTNKIHEIINNTLNTKVKWHIKNITSNICNIKIVNEHDNIMLLITYILLLIFSIVTFIFVVLIERWNEDINKNDEYVLLNNDNA